MANSTNYDQLVVRGTLTDQTGAGGAQNLMPEEVSSEIIKAATQKSAALSLFRHKTMTRAQTRMPVLALFPTAYFVNGDTGLKQTSRVNWASVYLNAEEAAVIMPIPNAVVADSEYPLWDEIKPLAEEAVGVLIDNAIFFGLNKPSSWPTCIADAAIAAGNVVVPGVATHTPGPVNDVGDDINAMMSAVEADGFSVNGFWAKMAFKGTLRNVRDGNGGFLFQQAGPANVGISNMNTGLDRSEGILANERVIFNNAGLNFNALQGGATFRNVLAIGGDFNQGVIGIRQDIEWTLLKEAVIQDGSGAIVYNLAQQDMQAMRLTMRLAFAVPNPMTRANSTLATRYPFSVLALTHANSV